MSKNNIRYLSSCFKMASREAVINLFQQADAICFDVDSTVCTGEGIDDLALYCGKGQEVKEMTCKAMSGNMDFRKALELRLDIIQPNHDQVTAVAKDQTLKITPNMKNLISTLYSLNKKPFLISGGFDCLIHPVAHLLGIPRENVYANKIKFYYDGYYAGFDEEQPTSRSGGKGKVIEAIREKFGYSVILMIGDGITDMEACPPADAFIGFGGNVVREVVKANSSWFVTDFQELIDVLNVTV